MKTAVIYARYSSDRQTEQSIEGQLHVCQDYAQRNDIVIVDNYIDRAMSGTTDNRPAFKQMLKDSAKKQWDYVIVYKLDRFSRNKYENAIHKKTLKDNGVKLLSAMENIPKSPEGIILESILEGMNQYYSLELAQKVSRGLRESRAKGQFTGGTPPYGYYVKDKKVYIKEDEAEIVKLIFERKLAGIEVPKIIQEIHAMGVLHRGRPFLPNALYDMLANKRYIGIDQYKNDVYTNIYPPIIDEDTFYSVRAQSLLNKSGRSSVAYDYLLRGKLKCGCCGANIAGESAWGRNKVKHFYYKCTRKKKNAKACQNKGIRKERMEGLILGIMKKVLLKPQNLDIIANNVMAVMGDTVDTDNLLASLTTQKIETQTAMDNILDAMEKGIINFATKERLDKLDAKLTLLTKQIAELEQRKPEQISKERIIKFIRKHITDKPKMMVNMLLNKAVVFGDHIDIYLNYTTPNNVIPDTRTTECREFFIPYEDFDDFYLPHHGDNLRTTVSTQWIMIRYGNDHSHFSKV